MAAPDAGLHIGGDKVNNVFELVGHDEDSISLAIAWALANSPRLLVALLKQLLGTTVSLESVSIRVHRHEIGAGITDIEIESPGLFHIIIEAKHGWILPGLKQLRTYARRGSFARSSTTHKLLVTLSECSETFAQIHMEHTRIDGIPVVHISWKTLAALCARTWMRAGPGEKHLLKDLKEYLEIVMTSQKRDSNLVYVLSLGASTHAGWRTSWIDIVQKYGKYFHPVGKGGWPKEPPNYLGFRYGGRLRSIHHVDSYTVIENLRNACPGIPDYREGPHFLYTLGKPIVPSKEVKNGAIWPNGRYWCALDTLLTCSTVAEARDASNARRAGES